MSTSALEAKRRVYTILTNALAGQPVDVTYGAVKAPQRSWAFVGDVTYTESDWAAVGARRRKESFDIAVTVNVILPGGNALDTENKTLGFADAFETALRADPTLGGLVAAGAAVVPKRFRSQPATNDAYECQWDAVIKVHEARI